MPTIQTYPVESAPGEVRGAIARAAVATGADFRFLLAQARIESSLDPAARAPTSSAAGLYQFIGSTWLETLDRHGARHGFGWASDAIVNAGGGARIADPAMRAQIMALRHDPDAAALMAGELAQDNGAELRAALGREPDATELYLAHFLGAKGAVTFLAALARDPGRPAAELFPDAAAANGGIFHRNGQPRSVAQVMDHFRARIASAMGGDDGMIPPPGGSALPSRFATEVADRWARAPGMQAGSAPPAQGTAGYSMSAMLHRTFGAPGPADRLPAHVRTAYDKLRAFGL